VKNYKIFCPDLMFNDYVKSSWCTNVEAIEGKLPINKELRNNNIYAIDIKPKKDKEWFAFSLPITKNWKSENLSNLKVPKLNFDIIGCDAFKLNISFVSGTDEVVKKTVVINISDTENWNNISIPVEIIENLRMIEFSGSSSVYNFLIKNIAIVSND